MCFTKCLTIHLRKLQANIIIYLDKGNKISKSYFLQNFVLFSKQDLTDEFSLTFVHLVKELFSSIWSALSVSLPFYHHFAIKWNFIFEVFTVPLTLDETDDSTSNFKNETEKWLDLLGTEVIPRSNFNNEWVKKSYSWK